MQKGLRKNCEKKVTPEVEAKVRATEDTPIIFGDFEAALEATANMVNGWSVEIRQFGYTHVCIMANTRDPSMDEGQTAKTSTQGPWQLADKKHAANQPLLGHP
jgi:hypothetical protein